MGRHRGETGQRMFRVVIEGRPPRYFDSSIRARWECYHQRLDGADARLERRTSDGWVPVGEDEVAPAGAGEEDGR